MNHSSVLKSSSSANDGQKNSSPISVQKKSIVISAAKDKHSTHKRDAVQAPSLGLSNRHIEAALGTIAPKAVLTLPPPPADINSSIPQCSVFSESFSNSRNLKTSTKSGWGQSTSSIPLNETVRLDLPLIHGADNEVTIKRRKPAQLQQLIQSQVLKKPGVNICDDEESRSFSVLDYYGCREEPLDELLLTTFQLIVRMPVQSAADIIVDMPDWMRKKFLMRFKLPSLINEVLSSRIDDYEQPEDDVVAVAAEVVWSNALAAGSMAEVAVTFFPRGFHSQSSLDRLRADGASKKLRPIKKHEMTGIEEVVLPVLGEVGLSNEYLARNSQKMIPADQSADLHRIVEAPDLEFDLGRFESLTSSVWGGVKTLEGQASSRPSHETMGKESLALELPTTSSSGVLIVPIKHQPKEDNELVGVNVDSSALLSDTVMTSMVKSLSEPRQTFALEISANSGLVGVTRECSLTLPPAPKTLEHTNNNLSEQAKYGKKVEEARENEVSLVRLDNQKLVLL